MPDSDRTGAGHLATRQEVRRSGAVSRENLLISCTPVEWVAHPSRQYVTLTRYLSSVVLLAATGTVNCAAHAEVFVQSCDERSICQVPEIRKSEVPPGFLNVIS